MITDLLFAIDCLKRLELSCRGSRQDIGVATTKLMFDDVAQSSFVVRRNEFDPIVAKLEFVAAISLSDQPAIRNPKNLHPQNRNPLLGSKTNCFFRLRQWNQPLVTGANRRT